MQLRAEQAVSISELPFENEELKWSALAALRGRIFRAKHSYLFVDPTCGVPWDRSSAPGDDDYREMPVRPPRLNLPRDVLPFFVPLNNDVGGIFDWTFELAWAQLSEPQASYPVCAWVDSDLDVSELNRLVSRQMVKTAGGVSWLFRFYDPRVSQHLTSFVSKDFSLRGPASWQFIDASGKLQSLPTCEGASEFVFDEVALERVDWLKVVNAAVRIWPSLTARVVEIEQIYEAARVAAAIGFLAEQQADCVAFIMHRCLVHQCIELHPLVSGWVADMQGVGRPYVDAAAHADSSVWKEISAGYWINGRQGAGHG